jgi:hypothetical protein
VEELHCSVGLLFSVCDGVVKYLVAGFSQTSQQDLSGGNSELLGFSAEK